MMHAIEFQTHIKNGIIEVPEPYKEMEWKNVKVIILAEEKRETSSDIIEELLNSPIRMPDFSPLNRNEIHERIS